MRTIRLRGGRGTVRLTIQHISPAHVVGLNERGEQITVPQRIIQKIEEN